MNGGDGDCLQDTEIVVWDVVAETGLKRLSGHKGAVTQVQFLPDKDVLVSASKDTFIKLWDIATGHCFKTIAGHITEVLIPQGLLNYSIKLKDLIFA